ncbi:MAG TPA: PepSY-associated TM helix domain-containing protein [Bacteroidales bacterium]|nr:PepSY-associated TM helix domain-containing protein [Bacteroidales bacterium]
MALKLSKLNRVTHRDIGYLITGMTIIYALSGIALNHKSDWNPNYIIDSYQFDTSIDLNRDYFTDETARDILAGLPGELKYKTSHFPSGNIVNIFIDGGFVQVNTLTGKGVVEKISRRPFFFQINFLHYNPGPWWKWFSDIFCVALIAVTVTGLFIVKGRNGITRRGAVLTIAGILIPLIFLIIYGS